MRGRGFAAVLGASWAAMAAAEATDLVNKDQRQYSVAVTSVASTMKTTIAGKTTKIGVCASTSARCVVSVEGVGEIEVTGADDVIIENGRLTKK